MSICQAYTVQQVPLQVGSMTRRDHREHLEHITSNMHRTQRLLWKWLEDVGGCTQIIPDLHYRGVILSTATASIFTNEDTSSLKKAKSGLPTQVKYR